METKKVISDMGVQEEEVLKLFKEISTVKSSAIPNISARIFKDAFCAISPVMTKLYNLSLRHGIFPSSWKIATIIPLPKEGDLKDINNYRPVSLLLLPGIILEKLVHSRVMKHLEELHLLCDNQVGFRKKHSTTDSVAKVTDDIFEGINQKQMTIAAFIDFKKAFDTVNHTILINKLHKLGITGVTLKWLENYLNDRWQQTMANEVISKKEVIRCGVPQGSILGPLLFLIFINDINMLNLASRLKLYADDTVVYNSNKDPQVAHDQLQKDLDTLVAWCNKNGLTINTKKTKGMIFGTKKQLRRTVLPKLKMKNQELNYVKTYKYLGIILDQSLSYNPHINETIKLTSHKVYQLSIIRKYLTKNAAITIYKSMILPYFDYGDVFLINANQQLLGKIQRIQNRGLKILLGREARTRTSDVHLRSKVARLADR